MALLLVSWPASSATFSLEGTAGDLNAPDVGVPATPDGPISWEIPNPLPGGRSATATGFVDHGIVRVSAQVDLPAGTPSIGDVRATMQGAWSDTITFTAPGEIPSLPGVEIIEGVTPGRADLSIHLEGDLAGAAGGRGSFNSSYDATLAYGVSGASGEVFATGLRQGYDFVSFFTGTALPTTVTLPVEFTYGEPFEVHFRLSARALAGYDGVAETDYVALTLLSQSALWQGASNVQALVPDGSGGTRSVSLPEGSWNLTSPTFDYTQPVPEPGSLAMLLAGLGVMGVCARRLRVPAGSSVRREGSVGPGWTACCARDSGRRTIPR